MKRIIEILKLRNSRFPSFFFVTINNGEHITNDLIPTIQYSWSQTNFTGQKPDDISEYNHSKLCLVAAAIFVDDLDKEKRTKILESNDSIINVGMLSIINKGNFILVLNNEKERIFLEPVNE
jgi:hypothetical protein